MKPILEKDLAFVAYCKCGKLIACAVDDPDHTKDTAKEVAAWIRRGDKVDKMTVELVRKADWCNNRGRCTEGKVE
jgi:hypothetical protein